MILALHVFHGTFKGPQPHVFVQNDHQCKRKVSRLACTLMYHTLQVLVGLESMPPTSQYIMKSAYTMLLHCISIASIPNLMSVNFDMLARAIAFDNGKSKRIVDCRQEPG